MPKKSQNKNFEQSLRRLEEISDLLDSNDIELEKAIKLYEEGILLSKDCLEILKNAELKITELKMKLDELSFSNDDEK